MIPPWQIIERAQRRANATNQLQFLCGFTDHLLRSPQNPDGEFWAISHVPFDGVAGVVQPNFDLVLAGESMPSWSNIFDDDAGHEYARDEYAIGK